MGSESSGQFTRSGTENLMRWDRRSRGFMEVWYATLTDRASGASVWVRYTLTAPLPAHGEPYCELWGFVFERGRGPVFAGKRRYSSDHLGLPFGRDDGALVRIGDSWLSEEHLDGRIDVSGRSMSWSLDLRPSDRCFHHLPGPIRGLAARRVSTVCSPNLAVPFSGTVVVDDRTLTFEDAVGSQSHRWGRRHAESWAWSHCSDFEEADAVFEGLSARSRLAGIPLPTTTLLYLRYQGEDIVFNDMANARRARGRFEVPLWEFSARNDHWMIEGAASLTPEHGVQVLYVDPDGSPRYCLNSEVAHLVIDLYARTGAGWERRDTLRAQDTAHVEFGRQVPVPGVPVTL